MGYAIPEMILIEIAEKILHLKAHLDTGLK